MTVYEQNRPLDYSKAKFDDEYALRFTLIKGHRELFTAWNVPIAELSNLIERVKALTPAEFVVEYHSPHSKETLFVGPQGLVVAQYRFNTKYTKNIKAGEIYSIKFNLELYQKIQAFKVKTKKRYKSIIQNILVREFAPNDWIKSNENINWINSFTEKEVSESLDLVDCTDLSNQCHYEIIQSLKAEFNFITYNNGFFRFSNHYMPLEFYEYWIEEEFDFEGVQYTNWFDAFLDACNEAEKYEDKVRLPISTTDRSIFKDLDNWKPYRTCLAELQDTIKQNIALEDKISSVKIELFNENAENIDALKSELIALTEEVALVRKKRVELNIRNKRQVQILIKTYLKPYLIKAKSTDLPPEIEALAFRFSYLAQLRKDLLRNIKKEYVQVETSYKPHETSFVALDHLGEIKQKGRFEFRINSDFLNILYTMNMKAFSGVSQIVFTLADGKTIFHYPSFKEAKASKSKVLTIEFDEQINLWMDSFYQLPQDLVIQACMNQIDDLQLDTVKNTDTDTDTDADADADAVVEVKGGNESE